MRQSIENKRETKSSKIAVTVMLHYGRSFSGDGESFCAGADASLSLSEWSAVIADAVSNDSSQPFLVTLMPQIHRSRGGSRSMSMSRSEKFSAEGLMARSALVVSTAIPNTRSTQAAATVITPMTEQRRCAAA
jgi:hypothetical protein